MLLELLSAIPAIEHGSDVEYQGPNPVPEQVGAYLSPYGYGILAFVVLALALFLVSRLNIDR